MLAAVMSLVANIYAIKGSRQFKGSSVATLAVVLPLRRVLRLPDHALVMLYQAPAEAQALPR
jgi:hypothetical protein